jgi:hypothetical protein
MSLPLRFTFASHKSPESVKFPEFLKSPESVKAHESVKSPESVKAPESWSQRYSTPICLVLTTVAGFMAGYTAGRYRK